MLIKAISYVDYNGNKKTKNFYFNLTKTDLAMMELKNNAGMVETIKEMINENDRKKVVELFEKIVLMSVGEKSADGELFIKNDQIRENFVNHPAYDVLFMELISNEETMANFINAILPSDIAEAVKKNNNKSVNDIMGYEVIPEKPVN